MLAAVGHVNQLHFISVKSPAQSMTRPDSVRHAKSRTGRWFSRQTVHVLGQNARPGRFLGRMLYWSAEKIGLCLRDSRFDDKLSNGVWTGALRSQRLALRLWIWRFPFISRVAIHISIDPNTTFLQSIPYEYASITVMSACFSSNSTQQQGICAIILCSPLPHWLHHYPWKRRKLGRVEFRAAVTLMVCKILGVWCSGHRRLLIPRWSTLEVYNCNIIL